MDNIPRCSCGVVLYGKCTGKWLIWLVNNVSKEVEFCPHCGDQLLPDGRVIPHETIPNKLMSMLKEVQATCPESGLQEFALKCFNWIEELREQAGLTGERLSNNAGINRSAYKEFADNCLNSPGEIYLSTIFRLLNAAEQEAK